MAAVSKIKAELVKMSSEEPYDQGMIGFSIRNSKGEEMMGFNNTKALVPASNMKVLTTATALKVLGENYRFETTIAYTGTIVNGTLNGDIIIKGSGDPTLGGGRIEGNLTADALIILFAEKIKAAGITRINGGIYQDYFSLDKNMVPNGWIWTDIGNYYGAGVSGLNFNENLFHITFKPGSKPGDSASIIRVVPEISGCYMDNQMLTGPVGSGDNGWIFGAPFSNYRYLKGTIPAGVSEFTIKGSLPDPSFQLVSTLYSNLIAADVIVEKAPVPSQNLKSGDAVFSSEKKLIYKHYSPVLSEIVKYTNLNSINLYAEALYRAVQKKYSESEEVIASYWKSKGLLPSGNFIYDGSGLAPQNAIRPTFVSALLHYMTKDSTYKAFYNSLPVAGQSGTLARFCKGTKAEGRIHAKSGSMEKVLGYSGYIKGNSGETYSFTILVNNFSGKTSATSKRIEKLMLVLLEL
jgi:D-alanyl-D-alanine carboxypeptidase/D-alanyl-D-alanine-endopeptidase (penicillin-binding protein 4)